MTVGDSGSRDREMPGALTGDQRQRGAAPSGASLVDGAEEAMHNWLAAGRYRQGDRLPPEHELARMLGVSRGTLRTALSRLAQRGEIVRRQGSGTYVGRLAAPTIIGERLERLEPYSSLAARRGLTLSCRELVIERRTVAQPIAEELGLAPIAPALTISRTLVADEQPVAVMFDVVHPSASLPDDEQLREELAGGRMVMDVLIDRGTAISFARTRVLAHLLSPRESEGRRLGVRRATAVLQLEELIYVGRGRPIAYSRDLFAPGGIEVTVTRWLESARPTPVASLRERRAAAGRGRRR
jgi:GntR family transcriptional regulator